MATQNLLYRKSYEINDSIHIVIPTVGQIVDNEEEYYNMVWSLTAVPYDLMAQLDEVGIDFTTINEYDLFLMTFPTLKSRDTSLIFGDLDLSKFELAVDQQNNNLVWLDTEHDIKIDRGIHVRIASVLRTIHHLEKTRQKPGNKEAKDFLLQRAKERLKRHKHRSYTSQLEPLIVAMVNTEQFKYDYEKTRDLSIYQFTESVQQIINKVEYEHRMHGVYAGTINVKGLSQDDLNWLTHK